MRPRLGRAPSTTHADLSHTALRLFMEHGFDATTVEDIAREAGIGRRTFFRYFPSKNDLPWGDFDRLLEGMRDHLASMPDELPLMEQLRRSILEFNRFPESEWEYHRRRMDLLLHVPTLLAHSTLRYASWRQVVAEHVARRLDLPEDDLIPQTMAWTCLGVCLAAYEQWLGDADAYLLDLLDEAFRLIDERIDTDIVRAHRSSHA
ncbi:mycofactocin system transcriptional regulator [Agromyces sp. Soil535]|uniref:mycofactocin system transcriptional regulator n=1 Tax=Agromyces sp. Soil535 TaxID=1736390 RepID=UPI00190FF427|nr:mycofactocin system transcriptional regulator [Agromyces sp. Soil535]